jgi:CRISPR/Cas system CMR subunit Cmr4 (Cas7 group RAMP superfamily)
MNYTGAQIKVKEVGLCGNLKRMGFTQDSQMRLYGQEFELMSDPIVMANDVVFVDAIEKKTGRSRRVRIPLTIVQRARAERPAA